MEWSYEEVKLFRRFPFFVKGEYVDQCYSHVFVMNRKMPSTWLDEPLQQHPMLTQAKLMGFSFKFSVQTHVLTISSHLTLTKKAITQFSKLFSMSSFRI